MVGHHKPHSNLPNVGRFDRVILLSELPGILRSVPDVIQAVGVCSRVSWRGRRQDETRQPVGVQ